MDGRGVKAKLRRAIAWRTRERLPSYFVNVYTRDATNTELIPCEMAPLYDAEGARPAATWRSSFRGGAWNSRRNDQHRQLTYSGNCRV